MRCVGQQLDEEPVREQTEQVIKQRSRAAGHTRPPQKTPLWRPSDRKHDPHGQLESFHSQTWFKSETTFSVASLFSFLDQRVTMDLPKGKIKFVSYMETGLLARPSHSTLPL